MSDMMDFKQSRKWQITINNPVVHGFTHDRIIEIMSTIRGNSLYWCMCDEEGDECETLHTHIFIYRSSAFTARQIDNLFPKMHRTSCYGTAAENRAYILKDGEKYHKDESGHYEYIDASGKKHTGINFSSTFFEVGECPNEHQGKSRDADIVTAMIKDGYSNADIVDAVSSAYKDLEKIERVRSMYRDVKYRDSWRDLEVTYIFGSTGTGKTRGVMEKYGYTNCYRVTDYKHPFDTYDALSKIIPQYPKGTFQTITVDNGSEFQAYNEMKSLVQEVYYCHPYCSSERGSNENANRIIRRYFPKGQSLRHRTQRDCDAVAEAMNNMHRKVLGYATPKELFDAWQQELKQGAS